MQKKLNRRGFLFATGGAGAALALAGLPRSSAVAKRKDGFGGLIPDPAGLIDLPPGFQYKVLMQTGSPMSNLDIAGNPRPRPGAADGMAAFVAPNNGTLLCVNHERTTAGAIDSVPHLLGAGGYDAKVGGGTSVLLVGPGRDVQQSWYSSSGTVRNCAGGETPWGTWITCEENEDLPSATRDQSHGWAFEVDPWAPLDGGTPRQSRLTSLGRFYKEAVAIDPASNTVYQTEDRGDGLFYRFVPNTGQVSGYGDYANAAGVLQALAIPGVPLADAAVVGLDYAPVWYQVPDPDGDPVKTRLQTYPGPITRFNRGEGAWWSESEQAAYFDTTGGAGHFGQVWRYTPATNKLRLVYKSTNTAELEAPDNLLVLPWGDIMLCEDGSGDNYLRILRPDGEIYPFAKNSITEFAGACFSGSPDTLYVNLQGIGATVAIWGPWASRAR